MRSARCPKYRGLRWAALSLVLTGCFNTANLRQEEYLLRSQRVRGNARVDAQKLEAFFNEKQKPNRKILGGTPWLWIYYVAKNKPFYNPDKIRRRIEQQAARYDRSIQAAEAALARAEAESAPADSLRRARQKRAVARRQKQLAKQQARRTKALDKLNLTLTEGTVAMRRIGEKPVLFDSSLARQSAAGMQGYLFKKGYFDARVTYQARREEARKVVEVTYLVREGEPYFFGRINRRIGDPAIDSLWQQSAARSALQPGAPYDRDQLDAERDRIDKLLKDNGYFDFSRQYIEYKIYREDSTATDTVPTPRGPRQRRYLLDADLLINNPRDRDRHRVFAIDQVNFVTDADATRTSQPRDTVVYNGVRYAFYRDRYSRKVLDTKLLLHAGQRYSQSNALATQRLLANLNIFRFANLAFDTTGGRFVANLYTSPLERFQTTEEAGFTVLQGLPGPFANVNFRVRNPLGGLEQFELNGRFGIEGQTGFGLSTTQVYRSTEVGLTSSLIFPQLVLPRAWAARFNQYVPRTRLSLGYNLTDRPEYRRINLRTALTYSWQKTVARSFSISLIDINYVFTPRRDSAFSAYLQGLEKLGNPLNQSFNNAFVTSLNGFYQYNTNVVGQNKPARYFRLFGEVGGSWLNLFNPVFVRGVENSTRMRFFSFVKLNPDFRYYLPVSRRSTLALRVSAGLALPYGNTQTLPYEKFFFIGGSNGMRAWAPRRLGPGADSTNRTNRNVTNGSNYNIEQPGNVIFEANAELRFPIFKVINGAVFVDAGNVWKLNNPGVPASEFVPARALSEVAVGTGLGLRFNFTFLVVRFDAGIKVYDPSRAVTGRYILPQFFENAFRRGVFNANNEFRALLNLGIGYPF